MTLAVRYGVSATGASLYRPAQLPPRGGVVCLHGSEGGSAGWNDLNGALFAANGFVALVHDYTPNAGWSTRPKIDNAPLDPTEVALKVMRQELAPYNCGVGLFGVSRGAEHALLLAQLLAEDRCPTVPDAVAVHSPPDETWPAFIVSDFQPDGSWIGDPERPAWSWRGQPERTRPGIPLGAVPCPVFLAQGTEDRVWDEAMARRLVARMSDAGRFPEAHFFAGEDHIFGPEARNREWELMLDFFARHLASRRSW